MKIVGLVLKKLQITEKATKAKDEFNKYLFKVDESANKIEIKDAVEKFFNVTVTSVNTMRYTGKKKRERMARYGKKPDWKRAVVTLKEGDKIDVT